MRNNCCCGIKNPYTRYGRIANPTEQQGGLAINVAGMFFAKSKKKYSLYLAVSDKLFIFALKRPKDI